ncbi:MAG: hypothetical protein KQJ78_07585 [Deltaproteobacteria bacterium]|nr:hypothetical protein [Deltaproteobacteria bacterium]
MSAWLKNLGHLFFPNARSDNSRLEMIKENPASAHRLEIAAALMAGMCANPYISQSASSLAVFALECTDALIAKLYEPAKGVKE